MPDLFDVFSKNGILSSCLEDYKVRDDQITASEKIEEALSTSSMAFIEAGTGIGKTYAYLVPVILALAEDRKKKAVISSSTIVLEKQIFYSDLPYLIDALGVDLRYSLLLGRSNYLCARKFKDAENSLFKNDSHIDSIYSWLEETENGVVDDFAGDLKIKKDLFLYTADDTCTMRSCPYYTECFYKKAREEAMRSDIVVTSHKMVLIDAKHRSETNADFSSDSILPHYDYLVLDEAHHIEDEATTAFSSSYSYAAIKRTILNLYYKNEDMGKKNILMFLQKYEKEKGATEKLVKNLENLEKSCASFDRTLQNVTAKGQAVFNEETIKEDNIKKEAEEIIKLANDIYADASILYDPDKLDLNDASCYADVVLRACLSIKLSSDTLSVFFSGKKDDSLILYTEKTKDSVFLSVSPLSVSDLLSSMLFSKIGSTVFISATLSYKNSFSELKEKLGIGEKTIDFIAKSPFDYKRNLRLICPSDGICFNYKEAAEYNRYLSEYVTKAILSSSGGALVLFTSKESMENVYKSVQPYLEENNIKSFLQEKKTDRNAILRKFKKDVNSVLFATSSFWEGIDAVGDTLRLLIITKLPFSNPDEPVKKARFDYLESLERGQGWKKIVIYDAILKLKQGIGRLIRSETDRGVVLILDRRFKRYSGIDENFSEYNYDEDAMLENLERRIEDFLFS
ncbi:MAG TPA: ATP-dependent DNA helicase [Candidatus Ornithospirochaeta avicola]|uniref:DNA 5'-3' helicase n=1 Tax=Candidatus Ornithospirochaeta avicola TaxID=2840896 RepID=A0A9D1PSP6_9SPIO|nr:ATP-dependent DNA helicase [Candidatus Ornithospirochaeta avicola]